MHINRHLTDIVKKYGVGKFIVLIGCFVLPIACIRLSGEHQWVGRLIGVLIAFSVGVPACLYYALNPKIKYIKKGAKLNKHPAIVPFVTIFFRLLFLVIGVVLCKGTYLPLLSDTIDIAGGRRPQEITGTVSLAAGPFPLLEFFSQEIQLKQYANSTTYRFYYPLQPRLVKGGEYIFWVLEDSKIILDAQLISSNDSGSIRDHVN